ncbi:carboxypeptidase regulatory-like domain-containing protein [bacterium]|nr:carboxypeptidase regulatory-like domain-containing protein [bacterium]
MLALATFLGLSLMLQVSALGAPGRVGTLGLKDMGALASHTYLAHRLPIRALGTGVSTAQSGPNPDTDLTPTALASVERDPDGSPSGATSCVVFASNGVDSNGDFLIDPTLPTDPTFVANFNIWMMRSDGSEQRRLTSLDGDEVQPAMSPSGALIAFASKQSTTNRYEIAIYDVLQQTIRVLTTAQSGDKMHPTWNQDGTSLAYQCNAAGNWDIYRMPVAQPTAYVQLTTSAEDDTDPAWTPGANTLSPTGAAVAYTGRSGGVTRVYWIDADNPGAPEALTDGGGSATVTDSEPAWSKDGLELAFASDRDPGLGQAATYNIWRMNAVGEVNGTAATLVTNTNAQNVVGTHNPSWSAVTARQPMRFFYDGAKPAAPAQRDIWSTLCSDTEPPVLGLPGNTQFPVTMDSRVVSPGADATIHAQVYDADSGVQQVLLLITNPDMKLYSPSGGLLWNGNYQWESNFDGYQYREIGYQQVAQVEMYDDGDPANGDTVAGDGIYSCKWTVPDGATNDWVIDIFTVDKTGNSENYDSVYGFSSLVFAPSGNVLFVNDYCEGQRFIYNRSSSYNDYHVAWYAESYYLRNPSYSPQAAGWIDYDSIRDSNSFWGSGQVAVDVWRVICRGPVPASVYNFYLPSAEYQLDPTEATTNPGTALPTRLVQLSNKAVIWATPHAGDVYVADGSIVDASVQTDLGGYLDKGGRLFMSGPDLAWALTLNGTAANSFLSNYLHAGFEADYPGGFLNPPAYGFTVHGQSGDLVADGPWNGSHWEGWGGHTEADAPLDLNSPQSYWAWTDVRTPTYEDASDWSYRPDVINIDPAWAADTNTHKMYGYGSYAGPTAALWYQNPTTSARVVYLAFGFESIHRGYHSHNIYTATNVAHCENHRSHLMHNFLCWASTGTIQGRVLSVSDAMQPVTGPNPVVLVYRGGHRVGDRTRVADFAVRCEDDGSFVVRGLAPGTYSLDATRPGYEIAHDPGTTNAIHGGGSPATLDLTLSRARPGSIAGTITSLATGDPVAQTVVKAWTVPTGYAGGEPDWSTLGTPAGTSAATGIDGKYQIDSLPEGDYLVRADGSATGYGTAWAQVAVTAGNVTTQDFQLSAADGTVLATVTVANTTPATAIANALVQLTSTQGVTVASGRTDIAGQVTLSLQPGTYTATVAAVGYKTPAAQSVTVVSATQVTIAFALEAEEPGAISGRILAASSSTPVGGITVELYSGTTLLAQTTTASTLTTPSDGSGSYNFRFDNAPTGQLVVKPVPYGFTVNPTQRTVTVTAARTTGNVNFGLSSLHSFPTGLQLVSLPYDYSTVDPATLLGVLPGNMLMAAWEASTQRYRIYPQAPADRFRLGSGYWMRLTSLVDLMTQGQSAPSPMPISLGPGWNLVGDPFTSVTDFYGITVEDRAGVTYSVQQALSSGLLQSGLFVYALGGYQNASVLTPWVGGWLKTSDNVTLHVTKTAGTSAANVERPAVSTPKDGWLTSLEVSAGQLLDSSTHFGAAATAHAGYDKGVDMAKPPAPDFAPYVYAAFVNKGWDAQSGNYSVDVRSASAAQSTWLLKVDTNLQDADVTVRWPNLGSAPASVRPVLKDLASGKSVYMRTNTGYTFRADGTSRTFEISVTAAADGETLTLSGVSTQQVGGGQCRIAYTLSKDADVEVEILNIAGRSIRKVTSGAAQTAGANVATWDGRSAAGTRAAAGRYLVRLAARTQDGQRTQVVAPVMVGR